MQRSQRLVTRRASTRVRGSFLELEQGSPPSPARHAKPPRDASSSAPGKRALPMIVKDYKETLAKLDQIEAELSDWLGCPLPGTAREVTLQGAALPAAPPVPPHEQNSADLGIL